MLAIAMKKQTKRPRGRPKVYERDEALATAMRLFWAHGYEGVSVADLSEALGVTPPTLYAAFGNKEQLFREALDLYVATETGFIRQAIAEEPTAFACISRILRECARRYGSNSSPAGCLVGSGVLRCADTHKSVASVLSKRRNATRDLFAVRLKGAVKSAEISRSTDPDALAGFYAAVLQGMSVQAIDGASVKDLMAIAETAITLWPASQDKQRL